MEESQESASSSQGILSKAQVRIGLLVSLIFYIAMFAIGIWGVHKCPVEEYIPYFLIALGSIGAFSRSFRFIRGTILTQYPSVKYVEYLIYAVELVVFIFGSYLVFKEYKPNFNPDPDRSLYCDKTVYLFAFVSLVLSYSITLLMLSCACCCSVCLYWISRAERGNQDPDSPTQPLCVGRNSVQQA